MPAPVRYPEQYVWLVLVGSLDIMLTSVILTHLGGREANPIAQWFIERLDIWGLILLKFATLIVVILICERIGAERPALGKRVAEWAIAISCFPVAFGCVLLVV